VIGMGVSEFSMVGNILPSLRAPRCNDQQGPERCIQELEFLMLGGRAQPPTFPVIA